MSGVTDLMDCSSDKPFKRRWDRWLVQGILFVAIFAYFCFFVRPHLIYDAFGIYLPYPEFSLDWTSLQHALCRPAGPIEYISAFLSQWFYYSHAGALIITAVAWLIYHGTDGLIRRVGVTEWWILSALPTCAALVLYRSYYHPLTPLLALVIGLWFTLGYQKLPVHERAAFRSVAFVVLCFGLYYLAGGVSLLFGLLIGAWDLCARRRIIQGGITIFVTLITPWLAGTRLFYMTAGEAYSLILPFGPGSPSDMDPISANILRGVFVFPLLAFLVVSVGRPLSGMLNVRPAIRTEETQRRRLGFLRSPILPTVLQVLMLAAAVAVGALYLPTSDREKRFEMVHFTRDRMWGEVLHAARQMPIRSYDSFCSHLANRAMYHTGRLGDDMFSFPQHRSGLLLFTRDVPDSPPKYWMLSETALDMGDINLAQRWAYESFETAGDSPWVLEMLALVCAAKGQDEAARVFLKQMQKDMIYGRRARKLLDSVEQAHEAKDSWLPRLEALRELKRTDDFAYQVNSEPLMLENILKANKRNRMAFEYLMAFYLLTRQNDKIMENLHRLDDFGYQQIPRHYEEVILLHTNATGGEAPLGGRRIRAETIERFNDFIDRCRPRQNQRQVDMVALARDFGDSYWFYFIFGKPKTGGPR